MVVVPLFYLVPSSPSFFIGKSRGAEQKPPSLDPFPNEEEEEEPQPSSLPLLPSYSSVLLYGIVVDIRGGETALLRKQPRSSCFLLPAAEGLFLLLLLPFSSIAGIQYCRNIFLLFSQNCFFLAAEGHHSVFERLLFFVLP